MFLTYSELLMLLRKGKLSPCQVFVPLRVLCPGTLSDIYHECTGSPCLILMMSAAFSATA